MNPHLLPLEFTGDDNRLVATTAIGHYVIERIDCKNAPYFINVKPDEGPIWLCRLFNKMDFRPIDNYMCGFTPEEAKAICQREHETTVYSLLTESGRALLNL